MDTAQFDYPLPDSAIAQEPADRRDQSRLMVIDRATGQVADHLFRDLPELLQHKTAFFRNTVMVLKARLPGFRTGGGAVECLLLRPDASDPAASWWCLLRPGKRLPVGASFNGPDNRYVATVSAKKSDGTACVSFTLPHHDSVPDLARDLGSMPLPPYIKRQPEDPRRAVDEERYQTVYADPSQPFAAAAPTAGLHFTQPIIDQLLDRGHQFHDLSLHVGLGTFKPIQTDKVEDHPLHEEFYELPVPTRKALHGPSDCPRLAVGTTSLRAIEDSYRALRNESPTPPDQPFRRFADIYIYPPSSFHTDALLTNFHLPRSSLLCLVSAFLTPGSTDGIAWLKKLYAAALQRNYRFYSYGDAMLIL